MSIPNHLKTGLRGEQLAARYLINEGYEILASNFHTKLGETDIIALEKTGTLCFVEVKTRSPNQMLSPKDAVTWEKEQRLKSNAAAYMAYQRITETPFRFDIIEVVLSDMFTAEINHIKNAF